jgi:enoyl-CoA hydratase/carnithine racemase
VIELERRGSVLVLHMRSAENRFHPDFLDAFEGALDEAEAAPDPAALVTTGEGKFYSNGLDLAWMSEAGAGAAAANLARVLRLFGRVLVFPLPTVVAVNGHAFAGGGMLALAHDVRLMRADRGFFCLPEVDLRLPLHPGMTALVQARIPTSTAHEAVTSGRRYGGEEAARAGIVDAALAEGELLTRAVALAGERAGKHRATLTALKRGLYANTLRALGVEAPDGRTES